MTLTPRETWARLLDRARQELPEQTFKTWLEPTEALALEGETLLIGCPDQFAADWNESKHSDLLGSLAAVAAHAVGQAPGKVYNPLFIYGDTGLGKTHLMQAIAHEILNRRPETRITFIGTEQFTNELVGAI